MQAFAAKLMMGLVLVQAVSGWCCHRPCHCLDGDLAEACGIAEECSLRHIDHAALSVTATSHCQCHECQGFCTYVAAAKSHVARPQLTASAAASVPAAGRCELNIARGTHDRLASLESGPPVGLHLLHRSLLI